MSFQQIFLEQFLDVLDEEDEEDEEDEKEELDWILDL